MNRVFKSVSAWMALLLMVSCGSHSIYSGFKKTENGAYMRFYNENRKATMPRFNDEVTLHMSQYFNDSLLFTTEGEEPMTLVLREAEFVGDVADGVLMMHVGDSARLVVLADSVFVHLMGVEEVPEEFAGMPIYYDLKLIAVKPFEALENERQVLFDSLRQAEDEFLAPLRDDPNNTIEASGLIVMEKKGKGKLANLGDYVDFDIMLCSHNGDTIMSSFGDEPVDMQYGEEFICDAFTDAIGMIPEGGSMRFVVPSELAFDSVGVEHFIQPYTALLVEMRMNSIMDKAAHDKKTAAQEAAKKAELERLKAMEGRLIADYIKKNNITVTPTESGLYILRVKEGEGDLAKWGDEVGVHYVLRNLKGEQLESSYDYEQPMHFQIGSDEMIHAVEEAVMTMAPGAKVTLVTPSALAFGDYDLGETLPPYSPIVIELELVEVK